MPSDRSSTVQRRNAFDALLLFTIPAAALFFLVNAYHNLVFLPVTDAVLSATSIALLIASRRGAALVPIAAVYLVTLAGVIAALIARPDIHPNGYIFITCIPVLSYILLGHRGGLWMTSGSLAAATVAYCLGCWVLMLLLFFGGVMNLYWIAGVALYVLLEKTLPLGHWLDFAVGALLTASGGWLLVAVTLLN